MAKQIKAPTVAPSQTVKETGKGPTVKGQAGHPAQPPLAPAPRMNATTGPKIASPSVDYDAQQGGGRQGPASPVSVYSSEQQQQKKRR